LDVSRISCWNLCKGFTQYLAKAAVLYAQGYIGNSVSDRASVHCGNRGKGVYILLGNANEMAETTLQRKTERELGEGRNDVHDWFINGTQIQCHDCILPVLEVSWIHYKPP
jgi:hypothetical protein